MLKNIFPPHSRAKQILQLPRRKFQTSSIQYARILASDSISNICGEVFTSRGHELDVKTGLSKAKLLEVIADYDGLVVRSGTKVTSEIIDAGKNLKIIGRAGTGVDNIDVKAATNKGILVVNTPGGNTVSTAELAVCHIMALARKIPQATASLKAQRWDRALFTGSELSNKVLGVIGVGRIGAEVAKTCRGLGMRTIGYDPVVSRGTALASGMEPVSLEEIFSTADYITIHAPLTKDTENMINKESLNTCKKGVKIINCARGGIVNEKDLLQALNDGQVGGAGLDTFVVEPPGEDSKELRLHPNVVVSPHLGASTEDAQERVAKAIAENMSDILNGGAFVGVINAPDFGAVAKDPKIVPYVTLAERIGSIHSQLLGANKIASINVTLKGKDIASSGTADVIKSAIIKGALSQIIIRPVSYVNAISTADEIGLRVNMNLSSEADKTMPYRNLMSVEVEIEGVLNMSRIIEGTNFGDGGSRITNIDGFSLDVPTGLNMLLFNNYDEPGVLRRVCEKLAAANVNIGHFSLGRRSKGKMAMGVLSCDTEVPDETITAIGKYNDISNVMQVRLNSSVEANFRVHSTSEIVGTKKPVLKPRPQFSSGPCKKRPGYSLDNLRVDVLGRSHRSKLGKSRLQKSIEDSKSILGIPDDYVCGIVPASDTGAYEMAMWNMLGERPIDACHWESFGKGWNDDAIKHLGLQDMTRTFTASYGELPDLTKTDPNHDILFTFNGTTSGVRVPNLDWISDDRTGLTFNDATSAAFAMDIDWKKADVTTYSWQKALGGEGAHGMLILSPAAVNRLETYDPKRPLPKIFRLTKGGKLEHSIFKGDTINTPSMLCVEDYLDALAWSESIGGLPALIERSQRNLSIIEKFVDENDWVNFLAKDPSTRSSTSVCLTLDLSQDQVKQFIKLLEMEAVAYDIGAYRDAPDGLRIWCGATVEEEDLSLLMPWLKWAYESVKQ